MEENKPSNEGNSESEEVSHPNLETFKLLVNRWNHLDNQFWIRFSVFIAILTIISAILFFFWAGFLDKDNPVYFYILFALIITIIMITIEIIWWSMLERIDWWEVTNRERARHYQNTKLEKIKFIVNPENIEQEAKKEIRKRGWLARRNSMNLVRWFMRILVGLTIIILIITVWNVFFPPEFHK